MAKKETKKEGAALVLDVIEKSSIWLFHDQLNEAYAVIDGDGATVMKVDSEKFHNWLFNHVYDETGKISNTAACEAAIKVMKHKAEIMNFFALGVRVTSRERDIWYDLGGQNFVHINTVGWTISNPPQPILFKRFSH